MALRAALLALAFPALAAGGAWRPAASLPVPRTEVAAAVSDRQIAIVGGFLQDGSSSPRVDLCSPLTDSWRRAPDLPVAVNHAMAATVLGHPYVAGGYNVDGALRRAFVLDGGRWRALPQLPSRRAAGGAVGLGGRLYAIAGRTAGIATNVDLVESWRPSAAVWRRLAPLPEPRGGIGAAVALNVIVSVGGEAPTGTIGRVYGYRIASGRWERLPDLPTPRHGLGVAAVGSAVCPIGGGLSPGRSVTSANELLKLG